MSRERILPTVAFGWYYFARCAANNRKIITNSFERDTFRDLLSATLAAQGMRVHFVYVDENEMHLGVRAGGSSLTKILGGFCEQYARRINQSRNDNGSLFRPHAHVLLVQPGRWFALMGRFIHWVPRLRGPDSPIGLSQFNSDPYYRNRERTRGLETSTILRMISCGSRNPRVQDEAYRVIFDEPPSANEIELFRRGSAADPRIVGDREFISRTFRKIGVTQHPRARDQSGSAEKIPSIILRMIGRFHVLCNEGLPPARAQRWVRVSTMEKVCSKSRQPPLPMLRALITSHLVANRRFRLKHVETVFHCRPRTLSAGRRRAYEAKFEALFGRPYQAAFLGGDFDWTAITGERVRVGVEPAKDVYVHKDCRS
jgi:hypothetical protein